MQSINQNLPLSGLIQLAKYISYFSQKTGFDITWKLSPLETIYMKCLNLFPGENMKNIQKCHMLKILPRLQSINYNTAADAIPYKLSSR